MIPDGNSLFDVFIQISASWSSFPRCFMQGMHLRHQRWHRYAFPSHDACQMMLPVISPSPAAFHLEPSSQHADECWKVLQLGTVCDSGVWNQSLNEFIWMVMICLASQSKHTGMVGWSGIMSLELREANTESLLKQEILAILWAESLLRTDGTVNPGDLQG